MYTKLRLIQYTKNQTKTVKIKQSKFSVQDELDLIKVQKVLKEAENYRRAR